MKKIIISLFVLMVAGHALKAQQLKSVSGDAPVMSVADANKLNGTAQPTINGKPYSQYKAEQEQLKQQRAAKEAALVAQARNSDNNDLVTVSATTAPKAAAKPTSGLPPVQKNDGPAAIGKPAPATVSPVTSPAAVATTPISLADMPMVTLAGEDVQAATAAKEAEAKRQQEINKAISQKPVLPESAKTKTEQDPKNVPPAAKTTVIPAKLEKAPVNEN